MKLKTSQAAPVTLIKAKMTLWSPRECRRQTRTDMDTKLEVSLNLLPEEGVSAGPSCPACGLLPETLSFQHSQILMDRNTSTEDNSPCPP